MNIAPTRVEPTPPTTNDPELLIAEARKRGRRHLAVGLSVGALVAGLIIATLVANDGNGAPRGGKAAVGSAATGTPTSTTVAKLCATRTPTSLPLHASTSFPIGSFRAGSFTARLELCQKSAVSGYPVRAVLAIVNHTDRTLATYQCPSAWIYSGVARGVLSSVPAAASVTDLCRRPDGSPYVPPGVSYVTIELPTVSSSCDRGATVIQQGTLPCTRNGGWPPALPRGRYLTSMQLWGLPLHSDTLPVQRVVLTSCTAGKHCSCSPVGDRPVGGRWVPFC
jgi:hypothetical protein